MSSAGLALTAVFSYKLLMSSLIGKLFHFKPFFEGEIKTGKKQKKGKTIKKDKKGTAVY